MLTLHLTGALPIDLSFDLNLNNVCFFLSLFCNLFVIDIGTVSNAMNNDKMIKKYIMNNSL